LISNAALIRGRRSLKKIDLKCGAYSGAALVKKIDLKCGAYSGAALNRGRRSIE
jgi:ribosomal protein L40E